MSPNPPKFDNSYAALPAQFYTQLSPTPVRSPALIRLNTDLAQEMGLDPDWLAGDDGLSMLAGNAMPDGAEPLAQVYAGHQFGGWSPQLGDGRAHLLGEVRGPDGRHWDIQLKGSGPTPYSRMGDGRAWLGPVLREYIVSEAMSALSVPTTRALAAVSTGEDVLREGRFPGAVLTRVAPSHLRVGTFQYFAAREDTGSLRTLLDFAISRHYPELDAGDALGFLKSVIRAQARLVAHWMGLGFIHGVMNTDNTHIGGITIDYGPCAFMDDYVPSKVFSSIDQFGRYAYQAQPEILVWNLAQLASCLLSLIDPHRNAAIAAAEEALQDYGALYTKHWQRVFFAKIGLDYETSADRDADTGLVQQLLQEMAESGEDFTLSFTSLTDRKGAWADAWRTRRSANFEERLARANPQIIPRNHMIEAAIADAVQGDFGLFERMTEALSTPYQASEAFAKPPDPSEAVTQTFCGT